MLSVGRTRSILGPGSLFTSVLAALAVDGIRDAAADSPGRLVYICNLRPQDPETTGFGVADHVDALAHHGIKPDVVLYDPATIDGAEGVADAVGVPLARPSGLAHDARLLGAALADLSMSCPGGDHACRATTAPRRRWTIGTVAR